MLDAVDVERGAVRLAASDPVLGMVVERYGRPPSWFRDPGFATLVLLILEQQVSLASAAAAYRRLEAQLGSVDPAGFATLDAAQLRAIGFSRQKAAYGRALAGDILSGRVSLDAVALQPDDEARTRLMELQGVGPWTADCYLLFALRRTDVWPRGDRALHIALGAALGHGEPVSGEAGAVVAERWRPWRSVAARILWHGYLAERAR